MTQALLILLVSCIPLTTILGVWIGQRQRKSPTDSQMAKYMNKVVNQEEIEHRQKVTKFRMARNGRKTTRVDSGPNAAIRRMRVRPTSKRFRED